MVDFDTTMPQEFRVIVNHDDKAFTTPIIGESIPMTDTKDNAIIVDLLSAAMAPLQKAYTSVRKSFFYEINRLHSLPPENPSEQKAYDQLKKNDTEYIGCNEEATHNFLIGIAMVVIQTLHCFGLHAAIPKGIHIKPNVTVPSGIHLHKLFEEFIFHNDLFSLKPLLGLNEQFQEIFLQNQQYIVGKGSTRLFFWVRCAQSSVGLWIPLVRQKIILFVLELLNGSTESGVEYAQCCQVQISRHFSQMLEQLGVHTLFCCWLLT